MSGTVGTGYRCVANELGGLKQYNRQKTSECENIPRYRTEKQTAVGDQRPVV